jgi:hypothetical protein
MASKPPKLDHARVRAAFEQARVPAPSDQLVELILLAATNMAEDEQPYNQFYEDELRKAYAHLYRILLNRVPRWRKALEIVKAQPDLRQGNSRLEDSFGEHREELEALIGDGEIAMNLPTFYHRMSAANRQGRDNVRGDIPFVRRNVRLTLLIQEHGYTQAQARRVVLKLFPPSSVQSDADADEALKKAIQRHKRTAGA